MYSVLWLVTAWVGAPQLERREHQAFIQRGLDSRKLTLESLRERGDDPEDLQYLEALYAREVDDGRDGQIPRLRTRIFCFAPFVVRVEQDETGGFLVGSGWATTFDWIFGSSFEINSEQTWIS